MWSVVMLHKKLTVHYESVWQLEASQYSSGAESERCQPARTGALDTEARDAATPLKAATQLCSEDHDREYQSVCDSDW
jgi:hypothetical protein